MALLYRFTKLNDRYNTGIFTFIVTRSVTRDLHRDATTKDFYYGYHRWAVSFTRANDRALGVFLILRNPSPSTKCYADFTLTLLNREHFSRNEQHIEKQCKFTTDKTTQGVAKWIMMNEIQSRKFGDETGEFLLELSLGNIMTIFETDLLVSNNGQLKSGKFESASFTFGSFEWNVSIVIHNYGTISATVHQNDPQEAQNRIIYVFLNRLSGFDHPCRVQYRVNIGEEKNREDSGVLDQISDAGGRIRGFQMQHSLSDLLKPNGTVRVYVELYCCNAISEAKVPIVRNPSPTINCYDRNKQGWCIEADLDSEYLRLKLFFMDLHSVPRNHLRYISWIAYVIVKDPKHGARESLAVSNAPHSNYYVQDGIDMGAMMDTTLTTAKIKESPKIYLESEKLTVHVEWCDSIMLFNHIYHKYDDITRIHGHQMRREIIALTNENYSLEKQLISYQKTIGHVTRSISKDKDSESGSLKASQTSQQQQHHHQHQTQQQQQLHQQQQQPQINRSNLDPMSLPLNANTDPSMVDSNITIPVPQMNHHQSHIQPTLRRSIEKVTRNGGVPAAVVNVPSNSSTGSVHLAQQQQPQPQQVPIVHSPQQSPLAQARNPHHHQQPQQHLASSYHQLQPSTQPQPTSGRHQYHHKLPAIPHQHGQNAQQLSLVPGASPPPPQQPFHKNSMYIVPSSTPPLGEIRKIHNSLPSNCSQSIPTFFYNEEDYSLTSINTLNPPSPRISRSSAIHHHRSREKNYPLSTASIPLAIQQMSLPSYMGGGQQQQLVDVNNLNNNNNISNYPQQRQTSLTHQQQATFRNHNQQYVGQYINTPSLQQQQQQQLGLVSTTNQLLSTNGWPTTTAVTTTTTLINNELNPRDKIMPYESNYYG